MVVLMALNIVLMVVSQFGYSSVFIVVAHNR